MADERGGWDLPFRWGIGLASCCPLATLIPNPASVDALPDTGVGGHRNAVFDFAALTSRLSCCTNPRTGQAMTAAWLDGGKFEGEVVRVPALMAQD